MSIPINVISSQFQAFQPQGIQARSFESRQPIPQQGGDNFQIGNVSNSRPLDIIGAPNPEFAYGSINEPTSFGHLVQSMVREVNDKQKNAGEKVRDVLQGGETPLQEAVIAMEESSVSFRFLSEVRNKALSAYREIMRMQV